MSSSSTPIRRMVALVALVMAAVLVMSVLDVSDADARKRKKRPPLVVNSTADTSDADLQDNVCDVDAFTAGKQCTLRAAIEQANQTTAAEIIAFNIPTTDPGHDSSTGVFTIAPSSELPEILSTVTIDGYSQGKATSGTADDAKPNTLAVGNNAVLKIELSGANAGAGADGLTIKAANSTVKGLVLNRWSTSGVSISGVLATGSKVQGNYMGTNASGTSATDASGTQALGNDWGVYIEEASNNTVGGTTAAARNLVSGNDTDGVFVVGSGATGNKVQGNYIGTNASGNAKLGNDDSGVILLNAPNNMVGGTVVGARNLVSGNDTDGVVVGSGATGNKVQGNYIGTDASGTQNLGNRTDGVSLGNAPNNTVGGTTASARNLISGNDNDGVQIFGSGATGNKVQGNYIGTDKTGTQALGNHYSGVMLWDAFDNTVGGTTSAARNLISGNNHGVLVVDLHTTPTGNSILSNSIHSNGILGIDLGWDNAKTVNDDEDSDTGPNNLQNFPLLSSATTKIVSGTLNSTPSKEFTIQVFSNPQNTDEGKTLIGQKTNVVTDANGDASFTITFTSPVSSDSALTATATDNQTGDTSEFSDPISVS